MRSGILPPCQTGFKIYRYPHLLPGSCPIFDRDLPLLAGKMGMHHHPHTSLQTALLRIKGRIAGAEFCLMRCIRPVIRRPGDRERPLSAFDKHKHPLRPAQQVSTVPGHVQAAAAGDAGTRVGDRQHPLAAGQQLHMRRARIHRIEPFGHACGASRHLRHDPLLYPGVHRTVDRAAFLPAAPPRVSYRRPA